MTVGEAINELIQCYSLNSKTAKKKNEAISMAIEALEKQRWMPDGSELGIKCNKCGKPFSDYVNAGTGYMFLEETPNFCPNCGAKMEGGEQE